MHSNFNAAQARPKLILFQFKYDESLPEFLLTHKREHVKCLSQFFEVTVVDRDCDYSHVCEKFQPDLTCFETGLNIPTCASPRITNIHSFPRIPKVGLFNADAWCESRSGSLSQMRHWGIETFFSISVTAAEHTPELTDNLFVWPNSVDPDIYHDYGESKLIPVLLTGATSSQYPWRRQVYRLIAEHYPSLSCPHPGYLTRTQAAQSMHGEHYARTINVCFTAPVCGTIAKEVVRKHFEIPACRTCLITEKSPGLEAAGFVDMKNCVFATEHDVLDKLAYLFKNPEELQAITNAGFQLVQSRHTLQHRDQILQWFQLYKRLRAHERIIQRHPFEPLRIVEESSGLRSTPVVSNGLHLALLQQGDEKLWAGDYEDAEILYLRCLSFMRRLPEAKFKLALCNLYKGDPIRANTWVFELIQYTLSEYKATDPDPVEWAYYIISLLCRGKLSAASDCARQFEWLRHSELDRTRWLVDALQDARGVGPCVVGQEGDCWRSVHRLPNWTPDEWVDQICHMLQACSQLELVTRLLARVAVRPSAARVCENLELGTAQFTQDDSSSKGDRGLPSHQQRRDSSRWFSKKLVAYKVRRRLRAMVTNVTCRAKRKLGLLPTSRQEMRSDKLLQVVYELGRRENLKSALCIGAARGSGSTAALICGASDGRNNPSIYCISTSKDAAVEHERRVSTEAELRSYEVPTSPEACSSGLEATIRQIKRDNKIDCFDLVLIGASEIRPQTTLEDVLMRELRAARFILLDDLIYSFNHDTYFIFLKDVNYELLDSDAGFRNGYAIFQKLTSADSELTVPSPPNLIQR